MDRKQILDKVIKLLALSENNTYTPEAKAAKEKAAELMAKYDISIMDCKESPVFATKEEFLNRKTAIKYDALLYTTVSVFNGVSYIQKQSHFKGSNIFVGREVDLESNEYMIGIIIQQRTAKWKEFISDKPGISSTIRHKWMKGFCFGLSAKLRELTEIKKKKIQEYGLVPLDLHEQALDDYKKQDSSVKTSSGRTYKYLGSGFAAGKETSIHKGLGEKSKTKLIS